MTRTKAIACAVILFSSVFYSITSAQLPNGPNVDNAWYRGTSSELGNVRIFYGYSSNSENFHCRVDYDYNGSIRLLAVEAYNHIPNSPVESATTFYSLRPYIDRPLYGDELVRVSYRMLSDPFGKIEPVILAEDTFVKHCVSLLANLFKQIPGPEVKMFRDQYGSVFGIK